MQKHFNKVFFFFKVPKLLVVFQLKFVDFTSLLNSKFRSLLLQAFNRISYFHLSIRKHVVMKQY